MTEVLKTILPVVLMLAVGVLLQLVWSAEECDAAGTALDEGRSGLIGRGGIVDDDR